MFTTHHLMEICNYCEAADCKNCVWLKVNSRLKPRPKDIVIIVGGPHGDFYDKYKRGAGSEST